MSAAEPESRFLGCVWLGPELGEHRLTESGGIHFSAFPGRGMTLAFESIDHLDAVIGELSAARFRVATEQLAAESARRDSTPKDLALVERHYAHPELVNMGRGDDEVSA